MSDPSPANAPPAPPADDGLREIVATSVLAGLCPLIPIPFLDDWVRDALHRRVVAKLAQRRAVSLDDQALAALANGFRPATVEGCAKGCLRKAVVLPARFAFRLVFQKVLRKLLIPLAIKDCVDAFSTSFHEVYLVRHGLSVGAVGGETDAGTARRDEVLPLRRAAERVRDEVDPRPVERFATQAFRGSRRLLTATARAVSRRLVQLRRRRGTLDDADGIDEVWSEEAPLEEMVDELTEEIGGEGGYLRDLERRLESRLDETKNTPPKHQIHDPKA